MDFETQSKALKVRTKRRAKNKAERLQRLSDKLSVPSYSRMKKMLAVKQSRNMFEQNLRKVDEIGLDPVYMSSAAVKRTGKLREDLIKEYKVAEKDFKQKIADEALAAFEAEELKKKLAESLVEETSMKVLEGA